MNYEAITIGGFSYVADSDGGVIYKDERDEAHIVQIEVIDFEDVISTKALTMDDVTKQLLDSIREHQAEIDHDIAILACGDPEVEKLLERIRSDLGILNVLLLEILDRTE